LLPELALPEPALFPLLPELALLAPALAFGLTPDAPQPKDNPIAATAVKHRVILTME
jgi:hypothetical protein